MRGLLYLVTISVFFCSSTYAADCNDLLKSIAEDNSLREVISRAQKKLELALKEEPFPITSSISARREQVWEGYKGPKAFDSFLAKGVRFVKTPDPNTEHPVMAMRKHPGNSSLLHVDMPFKGKNTSTKVYVSRPVFESSTAIPNGEYLIGPEHKAVVWHIHGGGTPSAVAANASSKAQVYLKKGIPLIAVDQPGHGNGPTMAFVSDEEIFDWNYELMRSLIHPDVDIHLQGHSWGGMFTTRMWQLSNTDKYKQIVSYQAESPGADLTLGKGSARDKAMRDRDLHENMTDWEVRAAASDVDFLKNVVEHRKMSPVAQEYTFLTDVFYRWEDDLTDVQIAERKRLNAIVGVYDGLVYVGREDVYDQYYTRTAGDKYYKFKEGRTFRGKGIQQGHQIFDMVDDAGDSVAFKIGSDLVKEVSGEDLIRPSGKNIGVNDPVSTLSKIFNHYANNFAFREFLSRHVEYVEIFNGRHGELLRESEELKSYLSAVDKLKKSHQKSSSANFKKEVAQWSNQFNVHGGIKKAKLELELDMSEERKQLLAEYIDQVRTEEYVAKKEFYDPVHEAENKEFMTKYGLEEQGDIAQRVMGLEVALEAQRNLSGLYKKLEKLKGEPGSRERILKDIDRIFKNLNIENKGEDLKAVELHIQGLKTPPETIAKGREQKVWQKSLQRAQQEYKAIVKGHKRRFGEAMIAAAENVDAPKGIYSRSDAEWELSVNLTPEREAELKNYIDQYDDFLVELEKKFEDELQVEIGKIDLVDGFQSVEEVERRLEEVLSTLSKRFIPDQAHPEYQRIKALVDDLKMLDREFVSKADNTFAAGLYNVEKELLQLKKLRSKRVVALDKLLEVATPSEVLAKEMEIAKRDLDVLVEVNTKYADRQENFYLELLEQNALTRENILNVPEELKQMALEYEQALAIADRSAESLKLTKITEAANGNLTSIHDPDGSKLKEAFKDLLGDFQINSGKIELGSAGIEREISRLIDEQGDLESKLFKTKLKIVELEREYLKIISDEKIEQRFVEVNAIKVKDILEQDLGQLLARLESSEGRILNTALKKTLRQWEDLWSRVNTDDNFKESDSYSIAP